MIWSVKIVLFIVVCVYVTSSPLNPQVVSLHGPFFQGWLTRTIDHANACSVITIAGSFSKDRSYAYNEHYLFCAVQHRGHCWQFECFPKNVTITGSPPSSLSIFRKPVPTNITWCADSHGYLHITDDACEVDFRIGQFHYKSKSSKRLKWKRSNLRIDGPEGWLAYTPFLPCHYNIHSTGSSTEYRLTLPKRFKLSGKGITHIESNHGTYFPSGWIWSQSIAPDNIASFSVVGGLIEIGPLKSMNFVTYLRFGDEAYTFRSTDADKVAYHIDYSAGLVRLKAQALTTDTTAFIEIRSTNQFGNPIYIPTAKGFSNDPGCHETYTAVATVKLYRHGNLVNEIRFDNTALEFGALLKFGKHSNE